MPNEHYPVDAIFNLQTYCTQEEAVAIMLGIIDGPLPLIVVDEEASYEKYQNDMEGYDYYSLQDHLEILRSSLVNEYLMAKLDNLSEEEIASRLEALKEFDMDYINKARTYLCHIDDELIKDAESMLRRTNGGQITLKSLDEWASDNYKISIFNQLKSSTVSAKHPDEPESETKTKLDRSLYITFGFLLDAFIKKVFETKKFGTAEKMNVSAISEHISEFALAANEGGRGQSSESIKKRIEEAQRFKDDFVKNG